MHNFIVVVGMVVVAISVKVKYLNMIDNLRGRRLIPLSLLFSTSTLLYLALVVVADS